MKCESALNRLCVFSIFKIFHWFADWKLEDTQSVQSWRTLHQPLSRMYFNCLSPRESFDNWQYLKTSKYVRRYQATPINLLNFWKMFEIFLISESHLQNMRASFKLHFDTFDAWKLFKLNLMKLDWCLLILKLLSTKLNAIHFVSLSHAWKASWFELKWW